MTAVSVTLTWKSGLDGGHPQTFRVLQRPAGTTSFMYSKPGDTIIDPGHGQVVSHTVTALQPQTHYHFQVRAINKKGTTNAQFMKATTLGRNYV